MRDKHTPISLWLDFKESVASHVRLRGSLRQHRQEQHLRNRYTYFTTMPEEYPFLTVFYGVNQFRLGFTMVVCEKRYLEA